MDKPARVVITGMGAVTPLGNDVSTTWEAMQTGKSGAGPITLFEHTDEFPSRIACEVKGLDPLAFLEKKEARRFDRFTQLAIKAAEEAMNDSGVKDNPGHIISERFGVIFGSGIGGISTLERQHDILREKGPRAVSPFFIPMFIPDIAAGLISIRCGAKGPNYATVSACASSAHAIIDAYRYISQGETDVMIAGGSESTLTPLAVMGFANMKALSRRNEFPEEASRPFDAERDGFVIGEGAGALVMESLEIALKRGAHIVAEIIGYGVSADAYHITLPAPEGAGAQIAMQRALKSANLQPDQVDYINAHGTSTLANDKNETSAIKSVFGSHANSLLVSSTKSMTGHLLGAAGAVEAIVSALVCQRGQIPPTTNYTTPDPDCDLNYVPNYSIQQEVSVALSNSFGFGGHNACLALRSWNHE
ncbi:MAG: beta-ketoacyl-ACP synthase II [bacterium]